jgi:hypothetical protein
MPKKIHRAVVVEMTSLREYKSYLKENGVVYGQEGNNHFVMSFSEFQKANYNPIDDLYLALDVANEAWFKAEMAGQDVVNDICCDGYHARCNAMRLTHRIEEMELSNHK